MNKLFFDIKFTTTEKYGLLLKTVKFSLIDYSLIKLTRYPVVGIGWLMHEYVYQI